MWHFTAVLMCIIFFLNNNIKQSFICLLTIWLSLLLITYHVCPLECSSFSHCFASFLHKLSFLTLNMLWLWSIFLVLHLLLIFLVCCQHITGGNLHSLTYQTSLCTIFFQHLPQKDPLWSQLLKRLTYIFFQCLCDFIFIYISLIHQKFILVYHGAKDQS